MQKLDVISNSVINFYQIPNFTHQQAWVGLCTSRHNVNACCIGADPWWISLNIHIALMLKNKQYHMAAACFPHSHYIKTMRHTYGYRDTRPMLVWFLDHLTMQSDMLLLDYCNLQHNVHTVSSQLIPISTCTLLSTPLHSTYRAGH